MYANTFVFRVCVCVYYAQWNHTEEKIPELSQKCKDQALSF